jgi:lipopolysaccharide export LptBFGC system permease protein LptF
MKRKQGGMTLMSFVVVLAVAGFAVYIGMKLFPMYEEYYSVRSAMKGMAGEAGTGDMDPSKLQGMFFKRMDINYSESVKKENVKFERIEGGWRMKVNYEVRRELVGNLDVVGKFDTTQDLTRRGVE